MTRWSIACALLAGVAAAGSLPAGVAADDLPIAGTYAKNRECPARGNPPRAARVAITPQEITYFAGTCRLSGIRREENRIVVHAACKQKSGRVLSSDVIFTIRDDKTLDMVDRDGTYKAVLHRCPEPVLKSGAPTETTAR